MNQIETAKKVSPLIALLLSAFVLPGLGQLLTGRLAKGGLMAGVLLLWLPVAIIKVGRDISLVLPQLMAQKEAGLTLGLKDWQHALAPFADGLSWLFMPLIIVWFWALTDSIKYIIASKKN
ncbi:MAG: hypothetical protein ACRCTY_01730 [Candidatus Adiutrix sp.]